MAALLSRKEAAARLGISEDTLDAERNSGHLAYIQRNSTDGNIYNADALTAAATYTGTLIFMAE